MPESQLPHVAHLTLGLPLGGTERLVERMARKPPKGFRASVVCLDQVGALGEGLLRDGIELKHVPRRPGFDHTLPWRLAAHAARRRIDVLHCHQYTPWFYGVLARLFRPRLKILFTEHGRFYPDVPSGKRRIFNRILSPWTQGITAVSPAVKDALVRVEAFPAGKIRIVFNGIEAPVAGDRVALRRRLSLHPDWVYFILCARFDPIKWIPGLVAAFARVAHGRSDCGLILVGDGPEAEAVRRAVRSFGLEDRVVLPGFQDQVADWLGAADIFVLSSLSEGTSVSLIESMALGLPSVATAVGGNVFVVEDRVTGLLAPSENAEALAAAMAELADHPALRHAMGDAARRHFESDFRLDRMIETYRAIYLELLGKKKAAA